MIRRRTFLLLSAGLLTAASCTPKAADAQQGPSTDEAAAALAPDGLFVTASVAHAAAQEGALLLDARLGPAFLLRHPEGAVHITWDDFSDDSDGRVLRGRLRSDLDSVAAELGALGVANDRAVYVVGSWADAWGEEARIAWMLTTLGHTDVHIVEGGFAAWRAADLPTQTGPNTPSPAEFTPNYNPAPDATLDELDTQTVLLDVRTREEFEGATPHGEARGGHIDGAIHLEWTDLLGDDDRLRSPEEIRALIGAPLDAPIAAYCTGGVRSAFVWAALEHAGYTHASNYAGSWWEYAARVPAE